MVIGQEMENQYVLSVSGKKRAVLCIIFLMSLCLNGCISRRNPYPQTTCNVYSVEGMTGSHNLMCQNSTDTYLYSKGGIYRYNNGDMELLTETEIKVSYMACNSQVLYYECGGSLYKVYLKDKRKEKFAESNRVVLGMAAHGEDIFMLLNKERTIKYTTKDTYLYCYSGANEGVILDDLLQEKVKQPEEYTTVKYGSYTIGGFETKEYEDENDEIGEDYVETLLVRAEDDWSFSIGYNGNVHYDIAEELLQIGTESYNYQGKEHEMGIVTAVEDDGGSTTVSHCAKVGEEIYMLYQYGDKYQGYGENPTARYKNKDALFVLNPQTETCRLICATKKRIAQIAGFSVEKQMLYLLEDDGIYRCKFDGSQRKKLMDNHYEELCFEYSNGKLFVFHEEDFEAEFLAVLE